MLILTASRYVNRVPPIVTTHIGPRDQCWDVTIGVRHGVCACESGLNTCVINQILLIKLSSLCKLGLAAQGGPIRVAAF